MNDIINKISNYNFFNYLFPGALYVVSVNHFTRLQLPIENLFGALFVCYFIGLVISRIGSLIVEPLLKLLSCLCKESPYLKFLEAEKKDPKINLLSQERNVYRTLITLGVSILASIGIDKLLTPMYLSPTLVFCILIGLMIILFVCAYVRQSRFLNERINNNINSK